MANIILVAGNLSCEAWNRLVKRNDYPGDGFLGGGRIWDLVLQSLKSQGHTVYAPSLKDEYTYKLSDQIEAVCNIIKEHKLEDIVLVGASYCGMVITGIASMMADKIRLLVYLDAVLPLSGESVADVFSSAQFLPMKPVENSPTYMEKLSFDANKVKKVPKLYVLCTESTFSLVTALAKTRIEKDRENWNYAELPTSHLPMATHPDLLSFFLRDLVKGMK